MARKKKVDEIVENKDSEQQIAVMNNALMPRMEDAPLAPAKPKVHIYGNSQVCETDSLGYATPGNKDPLELVLDVSQGFIPLWAKDVSLRWRFNENSMTYFQSPDAAKREIRRLLSQAILAWGSDVAPVTFSENDDAWDFEIVMSHFDNCSANGCTLARAFFPDSGRHELVIYPKMFSQIEKEQIDTFTHEIGHIFGLRHFFANVRETAWPSVVFGTHKPFSIMNYGSNSELTDEDKSDLKSLYQKVWSGELTKINGTRIVMVTPFHWLGGIR